MQLTVAHEVEAYVSLSLRASNDVVSTFSYKNDADGAKIIMTKNRNGTARRLCSQRS